MAGNWSTLIYYSITIDCASPFPPSVNVPSLINNLRPMWTWASGGNGGNGTFRFKLDNEDLSQGATETTVLHYQPSENLSEGSHTLYVQERDAAGNWSASGSATVVIDTTPPFPPIISGPTSTNNTKPTWSWISGGGGKGYYMYRL
ncbi:MAG: Ig-like domain-containing protein, partial [Chitinispirillaceae bacterium]|nr:Ig-like domain-containing protein [Chitinispirillaceae bacterium]